MAYVVFLVLTVLAVLAVSSVIRGLFQKPTPSEGEPAKPFVEYPPPEAVVRTPGVVRIGTFALIWAAANLGVLATWAVTGLGMTAEMTEIPPLVRITMGVYLGIASLLAAWGGLMLLAARAQGRRMLSWAGYLFSALGMLLLGIALVIAGSSEAKLQARTAAKIGAIVLAVHLTIDVSIAALAQRVGLPKRKAGAAENVPSS